MDICNSAVNSNTYNIKFGLHVTLHDMDIYIKIMYLCCGTVNGTLNFYSPINRTSDIYSLVYRTVIM